MNLLNQIKRYFIYDDRVRTVVAMFTGLFIVMFNLISGFLIVNIVSENIFGFHSPGKLILLFYFIPGIIFGALILKFCISLTEIVIRGIEIEEFSYLRLVLLLSVAFFLLINVFYFILSVSNNILRLLYNQNG